MGDGISIAYTDIQKRLLLLFYHFSHQVVDLLSVQCELKGVGRVNMVEVLPGRHSLCDNLTEIEFGFASTASGHYSTHRATSNGAVQLTLDSGPQPTTITRSEQKKSTEVSISMLEDGISPSLRPNSEMDEIKKHEETVEHKASTTSMTYPASIIKKSSTSSYNSTKSTPKVVVFEDELGGTGRTRTDSSSSTNSNKALTPTITATRSTKNPRRGRHEPEHHRIVNALIFILFLCVIVLVVAIGFTLYIRFHRTDVEIVRSTSFEAEPLNR